MSDRDRKREEKERLMAEVFSKDRRMDKEDAINLSFSTKENVDEIADTMKNSHSALDSLRSILEKQQKDLEAMSLENGIKTTEKPFDAEEMERMQKELQADYGTSVKEEEQAPAEPVDSGTLFNEIKEEINERLVIDDDTLKSLLAAFRRPFVMGDTDGKPKNIILVSGPNGSGRHTAIKAIARCLYERQVFLSDEVYTVDMSLYASASQEQVFLQDLYSHLSGKGSIICFENFDEGFPSFLRMLDSLACAGKVILNKRYVLNKGILVENQTGLVKDAVNSLSAEGKYLIFLSNQGTKEVQNAFGADFLYHVLDTVTFKAMDESQLNRIINAQLEELASKAKTNLKLTIRPEDSLRAWVRKHYDKANGSDAVAEIFRNFYICLSQKVLEDNLPADTAAVLCEQDDLPYALIGENNERVLLTRSRTSGDEIEAVNKELDEVVGLDQVKNYIHSLQSLIAMQNLRKEQGMKTTELSKHMIFTGNPGTGKTTIARLISRYMKAIGALSGGQLVEVTRADLVAQYVGQTAPLTMNVIKSAIGGVLFIDEAYSLYRGKDDSFGLECIDTIVKAMEDHRDDLIIILAGYKKEMSVFLESNSGLKSRFPNLIDFPDYTADELLKIAVIQAKSKGYQIAEDAKEPLTEYFREVQSINAAEAGNGRLARNVVEDAILRQSERLVKNPEASMEMLEKDDFDYTVKVKPADTLSF